MTEVELLAQALRELAEHVAGAHALSDRRAPLGNVGEQRERGEVALHHFVDARPLHLHDDGFAGAQAGAIRLADRCRRERLPVELDEDLVDIDAELGFQHRAHTFDRHGRDLVLQSGELGRHLGRHEVDPRRRDLPELDVDTTRLLEHTTQAHPDSIERATGPSGTGEERPEPFSAGDAQQLVIAAKDIDPPPQRAQRPRRADETRLLAERE